METGVPIGRIGTHHSQHELSVFQQHRVGVHLDGNCDVVVEGAHVVERDDILEISGQRVVQFATFRARHSL